MIRGPALAERFTGKDEKRLARLVTWVAACIAIFVTLAAPLSYFVMSRNAELKESAVAARLHAAFVTLAIGNAQHDWRAQVTGLIESDLAPAKLPEVRTLIDDQAVVVDRTGPRLNGAWIVAQSAPILAAEGKVGEIVVTRSLEPIVWESAFVALLSTLLGLAIYVSLRILPLRALNRTLETLKRTEAKARVEAEENLRIVFEHALDAIIMLSPSGEILSCNPSALSMLGYAEAELRAKKFSDLLAALPMDETLPNFTPTQFETTARRQDGDELAVEVTLSETHAMGRPQRIAIVRDITERRQAQARLSRMANYDNLTGLPNRSLFRERLHAAMKRCRRTGERAALMFLDLDRFKTINDSLGHEFGDKLLKSVAESLSSCLRQNDFVTRYSESNDDVGVYRLGGDEFTILIERLPSEEIVTQIAKRILTTMAQPFEVGVHQLYISVSIGITLYPQVNADLDVLIKQADLAMYRSKSLGRNTYAFFSDDLDQAVSEQHLLETGLRHALERGELQVVYQPKANIATGQITGVEALLRWIRPGVSSVGPDKFIPILEETGLIVPVGMWVLREACKQLVQWQELGIVGLTMAVNLSARQFRQRDLIEEIAAIIAETGISPNMLEVELTESSLIDDSDAVMQIMRQLAKMNVRVAIDDFGTGQSSLRYLKRFDVHTLKIDRSFVQDIPHDPEDNAIAIAVIALGHGMGLKVIAEGVETDAQAEFLRAHDCDEMQGFLLSQALPPEQLARLYLEHRLNQPTVGAIASPAALNAPELFEN